jgi:hypothetical protein
MGGAIGGNHNVLCEGVSWILDTEIERVDGMQGLMHRDKKLRRLELLGA